MANLFTNLVQKVVISRKWTENGPMLDREWTDEVAEKSARMSTVWAMLWVKLVNLVNFVMQFLKWTKWTKWTEQIFVESAESAKSAKPIFATSATFASANFVGKASCESTVRYREWSRIPSYCLRSASVIASTRIRLVSLICLCMLTVGVGDVWGIESSEVASSKSTSVTDGDLYIIATQNTGGYFLTSTVSSNWGVVSTTLSDAAVFTAHGDEDAFYLTCPAGRLVPSTGNFQAYDQNTANNLSLNTTTGQIQNSSSTSSVLQSNKSSYNARWYSGSQNDFYLFKVTLSPKTLTYNAGTGSCKSSETEASGGAGIILPSATPSSRCADDGWVFAGWKRTSAQTTTTTIPELYKAGTRYYPDADETLYAVYRKGAYDVIDFESETSAYTDWTFTTITSQKNTITANSGLYYGNTDGKASGSIETNSVIAAPKDIKCYVSKETTNTTSSTWDVYTKAPDGDWTLRNSEDATDMGKGEWKSFHVDLSSYTNVYVKIAYSGSTAVRAIDDIVLSSATFNSNPDCTYDYFIDIMHETEIDPVQGSYSMPSPSDKSKGSYCEGEHYHFLGWVEETYIKDDGTLDTEAVGFEIIPAGDSGHTANNKTYYAIWAKEE